MNGQTFMNHVGLGFGKLGGANSRVKAGGNPPDVDQCFQRMRNSAHDFIKEGRIIALRDDRLNELAEFGKGLSSLKKADDKLEDSPDRKNFLVANVTSTL